MYFPKIDNHRNAKNTTLLKNKKKISKWRQSFDMNSESTRRASCVALFAFI